MAALLRWTLALVAGGVLIAVATAPHPSRETTATVLEAEVRPVAAQVPFTVSYLLVLLGLPGLYGSIRSGWMGRLGLAGFFDCLRGHRFAGFIAAAAKV